MGETYEHFYYSIQKYKLVANKDDAAKGIVTEDGKPALMHVYGGDTKSKVLRTGVESRFITYSQHLSSLIVIDVDENMRNKNIVRLLSPKGETIASSKPFTTYQPFPIQAVSFNLHDLIAVQHDRGVCIYDGNVKVVKNLAGECILGMNVESDILVTGVVEDYKVKEVRCYDNKFTLTKKIQGVFERPFVNNNGTLYDFRRTSTGFQIRNVDRDVPHVDVHGIDKSIDAHWSAMEIVSTYHNGPALLIGTRSPSSDGGRLHTHLINLNTGAAKFLMAGFCFGRNPGYYGEVAMAPMEWYGPYKRGGARCGSLYFMDLKTSVKRPVTQRLGQIHSGCWWVNMERV